MSYGWLTFISYLEKFSFSRFMTESSRPTKSLDFSNYYLLNRSSVFYNFLHKDRIPLVVEDVVVTFLENSPFTQKRAKSGRSSWKKSTFLYIAQNCLIRFFSIFCIKLEGIKRINCPYTIFQKKISISEKMEKMVWK